LVTCDAGIGVRIEQVGASGACCHAHRQTLCIAARESPTTRTRTSGDPREGNTTITTSATTVQKKGRNTEATSSTGRLLLLPALTMAPLRPTAMAKGHTARKDALALTKSTGTEDTKSSGMEAMKSSGTEDSRSGRTPLSTLLDLTPTALVPTLHQVRWLQGKSSFWSCGCFVLQGHGLECDHVDESLSSFFAPLAMCCKVCVS
jgi:hypothetical protein